jgi:hypothetical protein
MRAWAKAEHSGADGARVHERQIWGRSGDAAIDKLYASGVEQMQAAALDSALATFNGIVRRKPAFAEGWNKRATVFLLLGENEKSLRDCDEAFFRCSSRRWWRRTGAGLDSSRSDCACCRGHRVGWRGESMRERRWCALAALHVGARVLCRSDGRVARCLDDAGESIEADGRRRQSRQCSGCGHPPIARRCLPSTLS